MRLVSLTAWVLAAAVLTGCGSSKSPKAVADAGAKGPRSVRVDPSAIERLGVKVEAAGSQGPAHQIQVPGSLDFNVEKVAHIGSLLEGRVTAINAKVGDPVKKGQTVATVLAPEVASAQADYLSAKATATYARERAKREGLLAERDLTTAQEVGLARSEAEKADAQMAAAQARLRALRVAVPNDDTRVAASGLISLTSPIDGVVVSRDTVLGQFLHPNETALVVADLSELWATLEVFEADMPYLRVGADVDIVVDALPHRVAPGKLAVIEPHLGKASRSASARVKVSNPDGALRPGFFVRASIKIPVDVNAKTLLVPATAVQPLGDEDVVFVERERGLFEIRPVIVARRTAEVAEVGEGLARGERIAVQGAFLLRGEVVKQ